MDAAYSQFHVARPVLAPPPRPKLRIVAATEPTRVMSQNDRMALADRLAAEHIRQLDYIRTQTVLFGLLPAIYGVLTFVFGDELWAGGVVYRTALQIPFAPQSWGVVFLIMGTGTIACAWLNMQMALACVSLATALVLSMFMVTFFTEVVVSHNLSGLPPGVVYMVFSLSFMNRARLAWASR